MGILILPMVVVVVVMLLSCAVVVVLVSLAMLVILALALLTLSSGARRSSSYGPKWWIRAPGGFGNIHGLREAPDWNLVYSAHKGHLFYYYTVFIQYQQCDTPPLRQHWLWPLDHHTSLKPGLWQVLVSNPKPPADYSKLPISCQHIFWWAISSSMRATTSRTDSALIGILIFWGFLGQCAMLPVGDNILVLSFIIKFNDLKFEECQVKCLIVHPHWRISGR